ncbi:hypothetical protein M758_UG270200 [Ceratodon purpureus]|nr:hypothetical protein M758_UG270200 [Ceratodon purpureus]
MRKPSSLYCAGLARDLMRCLQKGWSPRFGSPFMRMRVLLVPCGEESLTAARSGQHYAWLGGITRMRQVFPSRLMKYMSTIACCRTGISSARPGIWLLLYPRDACISLLSVLYHAPNSTSFALCCRILTTTGCTWTTAQLWRPTRICRLLIITAPERISCVGPEHEYVWRCQQW